jgi:hypothetical protein
MQAKSTAPARVPRDPDFGYALEAEPVHPLRTMRYIACEVAFVAANEPAPRVVQLARGVRDVAALGSLPGRGRRFGRIAARGLWWEMERLAFELEASWLEDPDAFAEREPLLMRYHELRGRRNRFCRRAGITPTGANS